MESSSSSPLLPFHHQEESRAVEDAIQNALQLIRTYTEDPSDWRDTPEQIYQSLDEARNQLTSAWQNLQTAVTESVVEEEGGISSNTNTEQEIRVAFVDMITDAFADVLQHQHDSDDTTSSFDVSTLVDCLQSGLDMMNITSVSELAWYDDDLSDGGEDDVEGGAVAADGTSPLTPHEQRRRAMGFPVPEETAA
jgi:flagellar hook-basal body complex protein FliE